MTRFRDEITLRRMSYVLLALALVSGVFVLRASRSKYGDRPALQAVMTRRAEPEIRNSPGERAKVTFTIENTSRRPVTIEHVSTTCSCLVPTQLEGRQLRPGEKTPVEIMAPIPEYGKMTQTVSILHNGFGSPLALRVELKGRRRLPIINRVDKPTIFFSNLAQNSDPQNLVVNTIEEFGSEFWLGDLVAEHPSVVVTRKGVSEESDESVGIVQRAYEFVITWREIPRQREVRTNLFADPASGVSPKVFIGTIAALIQVDHFRPTAIYLQPGKVEQDLVLFDPAASSPRTWRISEKAAFPPWLEAEWQDIGGTMGLRLSLTSTGNVAEPMRLEIPLVRDDGIADELHVAILPRQ
jgi:hypothetical protein